MCDIVPTAGDHIAGDHTLALLLGPPHLIDTALAALSERGALLEMDSTVIVV